jgi:hypothetical protein
MKLSQIKEIIGTRPFRPFAIETSGGTYVTVQTPAHIKLPPPSFDLIIVYGTDGLVHFLTKDTILNAAVYGPAPLHKQEKEEPS